MWCILGFGCCDVGFYCVGLCCVGGLGWCFCVVLVGVVGGFGLR